MKTVPRAAPIPRPPPRGRIIGAYLRLTKPRIVELLLVTTVPAMILADRGLPSLGLIAATLAGGTLCAGGANAVNQYLDRDIDEVMARTRHRPLPAHLIEPRRALAFGVALVLAGFFWLYLTVNLLSAALSVAAAVFYVFVYTAWLKRTTPQNIVIGGAAGAVPVLVGWAAVEGRVGVPALVMFAIVFLWTPPHFWALSLRYQRDYAAAGIPMLPVVAGRDATTRQIVVYSYLLVASSLVLAPVGHLGPVYVTAALVLGLLFVRGAHRLRRRGNPSASLGLFRYSIAYLALLFASVAVDTIVSHGL